MARLARAAAHRWPLSALASPSSVSLSRSDGVVVNSGRRDCCGCSCSTVGGEEEAKRGSGLYKPIRLQPGLNLTMVCLGGLALPAGRQLLGEAGLTRGVGYFCGTRCLCDVELSRIGEGTRGAREQGRAGTSAWAHGEVEAGVRRLQDTSWLPASRGWAGMGAPKRIVIFAAATCSVEPRAVVDPCVMATQNPDFNPNHHQIYMQ